MMNLKRNQQETSRRTNVVFGVFLVCIGISFFFNIQTNVYLKTQYDLVANVFNDQPTQEVVGVEKSSSSSGGDQICPAAAKLFDPKSLEEMIKNATDFHQRGGNLVSIENYLNGAIQQTLDRLNLKFEFNDPEENNKGGGGAVQDLLSYYKTHQVPRGGYGQPLPGQFTGHNNAKSGPLMDQRWINVLEPHKSDRHKVAIGNVSPCLKEIEFAEGSYEGKPFCVPPDFDENPITEECNLISIGSNDQWGFEQEVVQKLPHCVTHTFDCTLPNHRPRRKPVSENIVFHPHCIGGDESVARASSTTNSTNGDSHAPGEYLPYHELWKFMHTTKPPKLLKIDVEGFEFGVIPSMLRNSPSEIWPEQIAMEVHWATRMVDEPTILRTRTAAEISLFFGQLFNYGGYLPVKAKYFDPYCPPCLEVLMVRVLCRNDDKK